MPERHTHYANFRLIQTLVPRVDLRSIRPISLAFDITEAEPSTDDAEQGVLAMEHSSSGSLSGDSTLACDVSFEADGLLRPQGDERPRAVRLAAVFRATYSLSGDDEVDAEALDAFADANALHNCWPYWREWLCTTLMRAGLPWFTLPVLVVLPKPPEEDAGQD